MSSKKNEKEQKNYCDHGSFFFFLLFVPVSALSHVQTVGRRRLGRLGRINRADALTTLSLVNVVFWPSLSLSLSPLSVTFSSFS